MQFRKTDKHAGSDGSNDGGSITVEGREPDKAEDVEGGKGGGNGVAKTKLCTEAEQETVVGHERTNHSLGEVNKDAMEEDAAQNEEQAMNLTSGQMDEKARSVVEAEGPQDSVEVHKSQSESTNLSQGEVDTQDRVKAQTVDTPQCSGALPAVLTTEVQETPHKIESQEGPHTLESTSLLLRPLPWGWRCTAVTPCPPICSLTPPLSPHAALHHAPATPTPLCHSLSHIISSEGSLTPRARTASLTHTLSQCFYGSGMVASHCTHETDSHRFRVNFTAPDGTVASSLVPPPPLLFPPPSLHALAARIQ